MTDPGKTLAAQARLLADGVKELNDSVSSLTRRTNRSENVLKVALLGLVLDLVLSVAVAITLGSQFATNGRLEEAIAREQTTREEVLCPLYGLIVAGYNPASRAAGEARTLYEQQFAVILTSYPRLNCPATSAPGSNPAAPR